MKYIVFIFIIIVLGQNANGQIKIFITIKNLSMKLIWVGMITGSEIMTRRSDGFHNLIL